MKTPMIIFFALAFTGSTQAKTKYFPTWCTGAAIQASLNAAPGIDPSSPATFGKIRTLAVKGIAGSNSQYELFEVANEDQSDVNVDRVMMLARVGSRKDGRMAIKCDVIRVRATR